MQPTLLPAPHRQLMLSLARARNATCISSPFDEEQDGSSCEAFWSRRLRLNARKSGEWESSQLRLTLVEDAVSPIRQSSLPVKASLEPWPSMKFGRRTREHLSQIPERDNVLHRVRCCLEST